jgi:hypothetical protein
MNFAQFSGYFLGPGNSIKKGVLTGLYASSAGSPYSS